MILVWRSGVLAAGLALTLLAGCGSRSGLSSYSSASSDGGSGGSGGSGGGSGNGGGSDACPSLVSGPEPMLGNCSTRDGRARAPAPSHPHLSWTELLPTDSTGLVGSSAIATDASGRAFVVTSGEIDTSFSAVRSVVAATGTVDWVVPITPVSETGMPVVLASGIVDVLGYTQNLHTAILQLDSDSGAVDPTTFGFDLYYAGGQNAVGADGSLYVTHYDAVGTANEKTFISRVSSSGKVLWTSVDLATIGPQPMNGEVFPSNLALGKNDLVVTVVDIISASLVEAFDPATGALDWWTPIQGQVVGGPAIAPDGSIVLLVNDFGHSYLTFVDTASGIASGTLLQQGVSEIFAITRSGDVLAGANEGDGITGIVALSKDGLTLWTHPGLGEATMTSDGGVFGFGEKLALLDEATGTTKWELSAPTPGDSCIVDAALTSDRRIVALQCNGLLFGAGD